MKYTEAELKTNESKNIVGGGRTGCMDGIDAYDTGCYQGLHQTSEF